jgi:hypothetical protein
MAAIAEEVFRPPGQVWEEVLVFRASSLREVDEVGAMGGGQAGGEWLGGVVGQGSGLRKSAVAAAALPARSLRVLWVSKSLAIDEAGLGGQTGE